VIRRNQTAWFARRAALAIALMIGFYLLAFGIAGLLFWIPYAEWRYLERVDIRLAIGCVLSGMALLGSVIPRKDVFDPPGPRLEDRDHPKLFAMLREVASATGQPMPADVYLLNQVNAFVTARGGRMGVGGVRVMGIGLPLIQALSVDGLRAVIAHEFGHFWAGDLKLGPWIHKTHTAIAQTVETLADSWIGKPFVWYNHLFLRLTMAVSRRQEFVADEVAARVTSPAVLSDALKRVAVAAPAFSWYYRSEVIPALNSGVLPPLAGGFDNFLSSTRVNDTISRITSEHPEETHAFDTHPPLDQRVEALAAIATSGPRLASTAPASTLIDDPEALAQELLSFSASADAVQKLKPAGWEDVGELVYAAGWRVTCQAFAAPLELFTVDSLPTNDAEAVEAGRRLVLPGKPRLVDRDDARQRAIEVLTAALGVCLLSRGWTLRTSLGESLQLVQGPEVIEPSAVVLGLVSQHMDANDWKQRCAALGLTGCTLAPTPTLADARPAYEPS
jgi:Zn-dependent protease with chaperone function